MGSYLTSSHTSRTMKMQLSVVFKPVAYSVCFFRRSAKGLKQNSSSIGTAPSMSEGEERCYLEVKPCDSKFCV